MVDRLLQPGTTMPRFELLDANGEAVSSDSLLGEGPLVVFFYPADDSPGCTIEACSFRDQHEEFASSGARVVGVSRDSVRSHAEFIAKRRLPYTLLSDPQDEVRRAFGVPAGLLGLVPGRVTFVMNSQGTIEAVTSSSMRPLKHVTEALEVVERLATGAP